MKKLCVYSASIALLLALFLFSVQAADPVTENPDHESMLKSNDPQLAANKRLVYDMWRTLVDAHDAEAAKKYLDKDYIQHNPVADTGLDGVLAFFSSLGDPLEIPDRVQNPIVAIVAERDLVAIAWVDEQEAEGQTYTTTWFDMYRIKDDIITEHWDHGTLPEGMTPRAYAPVVESPDHESSLASKVSQLAANKQLAYDMWRTLLDAQQVDESPKYLHKGYIQHNPMAATGLDGFMDFFKRFAQPQPLQPKMANFVEIIAEGDKVVLATLKTYNDADGNPYTTTWFDMWIVEDGLLVEHWDTQRM